MTGDSDPDEENESGDDDVAVAMVATLSPRLPDVAHIKKACGLGESVSSRFMSLFRKAKPKQQEEWDSSTLVLQHDDDLTIVVGLLPCPIPWSQLEGPCETAWWWPEATAEMSQHKFHFIVSIIGEMEPVEKRILLAKIMRAVVRSTDSVGVYWGDSTLVMPAELFTDMTKSAKANNVPIELFVDVRVEAIDEGAYRCFTTGLSEIGFPEIEVDSSPMEPMVLMEFVLDVARYIVNNYLEIEDGNTFQRDDQQFVARFRESMFDRDTVMKLDLNRPN